MSFLAPVAPAIQMPTPQLPELITTKCLFSEEEIVGVLRSNGSYYLYTYNSQKSEMTPHVCRCQLETTEEDLAPLYSEYSEKLNDMVFFLYNRVSGKVEEYIYSFDHDSFEEVESTGLIYNPARGYQTNTIAILTGPLGEHVTVFRDHSGSMRKEMSMSHHVRVLPPSKVETLIRTEVKNMDSVKERYDSEYQFKDLYSEYIDCIAPFSITICPHSNQLCVAAFNSTSELYQVYFFDRVTRSFSPLDCSNCGDTCGVTEAFLVPKYVETLADGTSVFFVENLLTQLMEQYVFNSESGGFEQVLYPELVYNAEQDTTSTMLLTVDGISILRDINTGKVVKERYSMEQNKFVVMGQVPVKTFLVQKRESEQRQMAKEQKQKAVEEQDAECEEVETKQAQRVRAEARRRDDELYLELLKLHFGDFFATQSASSSSESTHSVPSSNPERSVSFPSIEFSETPYPGETPILRASRPRLFNESSYEYNSEAQKSKIVESSEEQKKKLNEDKHDIRLQKTQPTRRAAHEECQDAISAPAHSYDASQYDSTDGDLIFELMKLMDAYDNGSSKSSSVKSIEPKPQMPVPSVFEKSETTVERITDELLKSACRYYSKLPEFVSLSSKPESLFDEYIKQEPVQTVYFRSEDELLYPRAAEELFRLSQDYVPPTSRTEQAHQRAEMETFWTRMLHEYGLDKPTEDITLRNPFLTTPF